MKKEDKDILEVLNDVKIDFTEYENMEINDLDKKRLKKSLKKNINKYNTKKRKIAIALIGSITVLGGFTAVNTEAFAEIAQVVEKAFSKNPIEKYKNYENIEEGKYRTVVNKGVTNNGITINLNEVLFDNDAILMAYELKGIDDILVPRFYIGDKEIRVRGHGGIENSENKSLKLIDLKFNESMEKYNGETLKIVFGGVVEEGRFGSEKEEIKKGKWEFNIEINSKGIGKDTKKIDIEKDFKLSNGLEFNMNVVKTPISTTVNLRSKEESYEKSYVEGEVLILDCIIKDREGNEVDKIGEHLGDSVLESIKKSEVKFKALKDINEVEIIPIIRINDIYNPNHKYNKELESQSFKVDLDKGILKDI